MMIKYDADGNVIIPARWSEERGACAHAAGGIMLKLDQIALADKGNNELWKMFNRRQASTS